MLSLSLFPHDPVAIAKSVIDLLCVSVSTAALCYMWMEVSSHAQFISSGEFVRERLRTSETHPGIRHKCKNTNCLFILSSFPRPSGSADFYFPAWIWNFRLFLKSRCFTSVTCVEWLESSVTMWGTKCEAKVIYIYTILIILILYNIVLVIYSIYSII